MASFTTFNYGTGFGDFNESWQIGRTYTASGSFVAPADGWAWFVAVGAGGSGGSAMDEAAANCVSAGGGGAGGFCFKKLFVRKGNTYTVTIGAGGTGVTRTTSGISNGNAGGNTTIIGPELYLLASGGAAGSAASVANNGTNTNLNITGALGGSAFGGDVNNNGMNGGSITITTGTASADALATGGGAVNIFSQTFTGNDYSGTAAVNSMGSGGLGVGGNAEALTNATNTLAYPDGGGSGMGISLDTPYNFFGLQVDGPGGTTAGSDAGSGGGGYGAIITSSSAAQVNPLAGNGGIFGGGGAAAFTQSGSSTGLATATAGAAGRGGGGGGAAAYGSSNISSVSGAGGSGLVLIFWGAGQ